MQLKWYAAAVLGLLIFSSGLIYGLRAHQIHSLRGAIRDQIQAVIPELQLEEGREVIQLAKENRKLDEELKALGSRSAFSPVDVLISLSNEIPRGSGIEITRVRVRGAKMTMEGVAPSYKAVEAATRALTRLDEIYCRVDSKQTSTTRGGSRGFTFEIDLCE